ncbi:TAXI family TRAP transporter solute-binding subunit [Maritimibacter alkaliphilus]|uniref:TAXI family TRAP transporter solute-binding subunit n=1 Tax=Maritimibacter alkaliphilus TaxID=404236 RepID=UPI001C95B691|nr:TAXI family TRAP transporter solute-binding subunit [Maritimibacter alkaliphilus]MBY6092554.1 TAXI family TRAP transporter solute-binding subunit [Maritimibacter alkaliphilus]
MKRTILAALGAAVLCAPAVRAQDILFGSTSASSSHYGYIVAVGKLINDSDSGLSATVVETGAAMDNIRRMERGQIDLGIITTNVVQHAVAGTKEFDGRPQDLQLLWVYAPSPQNVIVRADAGIDSLAALGGTRLNPGIKGSATETTTEAVFDVLGIAPDWVRGSTTDIVGAIKDNRLPGYVKSGTPKQLDSSTMDIAVSTRIKVLGLDEAQARTVAEAMPDISIVDIAAGVGEDIPAYKTWSFGVGIAATSAMSDDTAYQIVKAVMEDKEVQANAFSVVKGADLAQMTLDYATVPLHPGALRWFAEQGIEVPERLKPAM